MRSLRLTSILICLISIVQTGCLDFGNDIEFLAPDITDQHLKEVSSLTGIQFPEGSKGLAYLYLGTGIDDALAIKVSIPSDQKSEFLLNEIFQEGEIRDSDDGMRDSIAWWRTDTLTDRIDRRLRLHRAQYLDCTVGTENDQLVVYVFWHQT